jgi:hypothetical protein
MYITGSMYSCLEQVKQKIKEICKRLIKDIPDIKIGIIAHGDYCDYSSYGVLKILDLCKDANKICNFVDQAGSSGGGDAPEAYELVLREANELSWTGNAL